jgi:uncharacterized protein (DUF1778 family)
MSRPKRPVRQHRRNEAHIKLTETTHKVLKQTADAANLPAAEFVRSALLDKLRQEEQSPNPLCIGKVDTVFRLPLTDDEQRLLKRVAKIHGLSASAYVREFILTLL